MFHQLERNDLAKIVDLEAAKVIERVRAKDIKVQLDRSAVEFLIDKGYDLTYGARPMRRAVEKYLEDPLAEELLRGNIKQGDTLDVHAAGEQLAFIFGKNLGLMDALRRGATAPLLNDLNAKPGLDCVNERIYRSTIGRHPPMTKEGNS